MSLSPITVLSMVDLSTDVYTSVHSIQLCTFSKLYLHTHRIGREGRRQISLFDLIIIVVVVVVVVA